MVSRNGGSEGDQGANDALFYSKSRITTLAGLVLMGATLSLSAPAKSSDVGPQPSARDPKLCWLLRQLRDEVPQEARALPPGQAAEGALRFSVEKASKPIADAIRARQMRINANSEVQVYIELDEITDENLSALDALGIKVQIIGKPQPNRGHGEVLTRVPTVQARLPVNMIQHAEELPFVRYLRLPSYALSGDSDPPSVTTQGDVDLNASAARSTFGVDGTGISVGVISTGIGGIFAANGCTTSCGPIDNTSTTPSPITLSDLPPATGTRSATATATIAAGTLVSVSGGITATKSYREDGDLEDTADGSGGAEGTALLEIVHALAPQAALSFANADTSLAFEKAVDALALTNDVVVDDIFFLEPSFDGTSTVSENTADALNNDSNPIRAYITSAGNLALNHYQGMYSAFPGMDGLSITGKPGSMHEFQGTPNDPEPQPGVTTDNEHFGATYYDPVVTLPPGEWISVYLVWNDPVGASSNNYDLFLVPLACNGTYNGLPLPPCTVTGLPIESSTNPQTGTQDPLQYVAFTNTGTSPVTVGIVIQNANNKANPVTFDMFVYGYQAKESIPNHNFNTASGSVPAQSDAGGGVISVGAINEVQCSLPESCSGLLEGFSSQGPVQNTPQAPVTSTNPARIKPDLVAVDEVCIDGAGGFGNPISSAASAAGVNCPTGAADLAPPKLFGGTSAAAPHVAAIAALTLQAAPCLLSDSPMSTPSGTLTPRAIIRKALVGDADLLPAYYEATPNNLEGSGLVDALASVTAMLPGPPSSTTTQTVTGPTQTVNATSANGASVTITGTGKDPNGCPLLAIQWSSSTCGNGSAEALSATITCPIGINTVQVAVSNNKVSFAPLSEFPVTTINVTDFILTASAASGVPTTANSSVYTITVASSPQGLFNSPVSLACTAGLPAGSTCYFSPATVTPAASSGNSAISTLTIVTPGSALSNPRAPWSRPNLKMPTLWYAFAILLALGIWMKTSKRRLGFRFVLGVFAILLVVLIMGCGSTSAPSTSTTPTPTTATVTITGTSNQLQHTTTVSLAVP